MKKITLTKGKFALVDDEDFAHLNQYNWSLTCNARGYFYAIKATGTTTQRMHRLILNAPKHLFIDHIDGNGLNNQKNNLRLCTRTQNSMNSKLYKNNKHGSKGVLFRPKDSKIRPWQARIKLSKKPIYLGSYSTKEQAAQAYKVAAQNLFKEFARV